MAPLGNKKPADLETVFTNSMYRCFVYDSGRLVAAGRALAGERRLLSETGVQANATAMAIFENPEQAVERGLLADG